MWNKGFKALTSVVILLFFYSCTMTTTYIAPLESDKISSAKKIIVVLKDGTELELRNASIEEEKIIGYTKEKAKKEIDFSLIQLVRIEKLNKYYAWLYGGVAIVAAFLVYGMTTAPEPPPASCPFVYSFDGEKYIFDAEPYGAAVCQGLKRTEWCALEHLKEMNGQYRIMVSNELDEIQYIDELKLIVVDHPQGAKIVPDTSGGIHVFSQPVVPIRANDEKGIDLLHLVSKKDWYSWQSCVEKNVEKKEDLREELIFEFPKPEGAKKAKLIVHGCTTFWGSHIVKRYLDLYGNKISEWYSEVDNFGPSYFKTTNMNLREELYYLKIRVETENGWKSKGIIFGGGPYTSEDKAYILDISDVPYDTLRIKLTPPAKFWTINYLAVDYSNDLPIKVTEIGAVEAIDQKDKDVREILAKEDDNYLIMPNTGDAAELTFNSPARTDAMDRTIILKASGYYDIHLRAEEEPRYNILEKIHSEPGFMIQYAFKEYLKWKQENSFNAIK